MSKSKSDHCPIPSKDFPFHSVKSKEVLQRNNRTNSNWKLLEMGPTSNLQNQNLNFNKKTYVNHVCIKVWKVLINTHPPQLLPIPKQACLKTFAPAICYAWNALLLYICMACSLPSFKTLLKCHLLSEAVCDHSIPPHNMPYTYSFPLLLFPFKLVIIGIKTAFLLIYLIYSTSPYKFYKGRGFPSIFFPLSRTQ